MEETVCHHKLAVYITEVKGWHTAIDGGLEKLVLERSRTLGRSSTGIGHIHVVEHHLLRIISADDAAPIGWFLGIRSDGNWLLGGSQTIEIAQYHDFYRYLNL